MSRVLAIAAAAICLSTNFALAQRGDRADARGDDERRAVDEEAPLTPGFGEARDLPPVPGFGLDAQNAGGVRQMGVPLADRYHARIVAYADQVLGRYDRNRSGKLERDEWSAARWRSDPAASDLNHDGVLTREELCERVKSYDEFRGLSGTAPSAASASGSPASDRAKLQEYAKGLLKRYDRNDNGVLEADEYQAMSSFHRGADANGDHVITRDELADRLANYATSSGTSGGGSNESGRDERSASASSSGKSYRSAGERAPPYSAVRVRSVAERLPKGLPDWFIRNDADGDGQISMAEFSVSWPAEKLAEFDEHDVNGDGLITPRECLSERPNSPAPQPAARPRLGRSWGR